MHSGPRRATTMASPPTSTVTTELATLTVTAGAMLAGPATAGLARPAIVTAIHSQECPWSDIRRPDQDC